MVSSSFYAEAKLNEQDVMKVDYEVTHKYLDKDPNNILSGEMIVIGDSYAMLLAQHSNANFNYIVHQGYTVDKIYAEFLPLIQPNRYKYGYVFIGANDYMRQTNLNEFREFLQRIVDDLKSKGMQVIFSNYSEPRFDVIDERLLNHNPVPCFFYDMIIKDIVLKNSLIYVDMRDILNEYGYYPNDFIHPTSDFYPPLIRKVEDRIMEDKSDKNMPNYESYFKSRLTTELSEYQGMIKDVNNFIDGSYSNIDIK